MTYFLKYITLVLLFCPIYLNAQITISGKVIDQNRNNLVFASIYLKEQKLFTQTIKDGSFSLEVKTKYNFKDTLIVKFVGYKTAKIPIYYRFKNIDLGNIVLNYKTEILNEISVIAPPPVEKIMKLFIKNKKNNYQNDFIDLEGFYRELSFENDKCIMLNEAVIFIKYGQYKNRINIHNRFKEYYRNQETTLNEIGNIFRYAQFFPYYIQKEDEVYIPYSRKSYNLSVYKNNPSPYGGPNDLLAMDKVKFLYDFLDPKIFKKYHYKYIGKSKVNDLTCYKIKYSPNIDNLKKKNKIFHSLNRKMEFPIYTGFIYINIDDYAVVSFEGQKYEYADFQIYNRPYPYFSYPDFLSFKADYKKNKFNKYTLSHVEIEKIRTIKYNNELIRYKSIRLLNLYLLKKESVKKLKKNQFFYGKNRSLRNFIDLYDSLFWSQYENTFKYVKLSNELIKDLEINNSLNKQFLEQNKTIAEIPTPNLSKLLTFFESQNDSTLNFSELKYKYDSILIKYIYAENQYYNAVMQKLKNYKRYYSYQYFHAFVDSSTTKTDKNNNYFTIDNVSMFSKIDSNNHNVWYHKKSNIKIIDLNNLIENKVNFYIEDIKFSHSNKIAILYTEKGDLYPNLNIYEYGNDSPLKSLSGVSDFFWTSDSTYIFVQTDSVDRPYIVIKSDIKHNKNDTLFKLIDKSKELSLFQNNLVFFLKEYNHKQSVFYKYNEKINRFEIKTKKSLSSTSNLVLFDKKNVVLIEHKESDKLYFGKANYNDYMNLPVLYNTKKNINQVVCTKDYIVVIERYKGSYYIKVLNPFNKNINSINLIPMNTSIVIDNFSKSSNIIVCTIESKLIPPYQVKLNLNTNELDTIHVVKVSNIFTSTKYNYEYKEITINDSISVPITILYSKEFEDSLKGLIVKTYGTYGSYEFPSYNVDNLIYANAGIGVVFVHPRGSSEKGYNWYLKGKELNKKNTFYDYINCVEKLKDSLNLKQNQIIGYGQSAGGLIMGVSANLRPDLFGALIFDRPYLNIIDVMRNQNLPLTCLEYSEFGNIINPSVYEYIKSYAPLYNMKSNHNYPNILIFNKINDKNAPYWNTFRYLVNYKTVSKNKPLMLMSTDLIAGHRGNVNNLIEINLNAEKFAFVMFNIKNESE